MFNYPHKNNCNAILFKVGNTFMKILTLIIHTDAQQALTDQLRGLKQVSGFTFSHAEGHGAEIESDAFLAARDTVVGHVPRIRMDILLEDENVDVVLTMLREAKNKFTGQTVYWITFVEKGGHL
jgi:nitrogen regulatory protein P-II 1